jgi:agmatinase
VDAGDVDVPPVGIEKAFEAIEQGVRQVLEAGAVPMVVGGDHSISLPCLRAVASKHGPLSLVQFDAHIDTWGDYFGGKYFHGSPFRRAIEEGLLKPGGYVQVGIRGPMYGEEDDFAFQNAHEVTVLDIRRVRQDGVARTIARIREKIAGPLYVTFDIDSVDPAYAPGTGTPEVGGLTSYEAQELVRGLAGFDLVGCDIVEVAPQFDGPGQITALLAANLMFELLCVIALKGSA